MPDGAALAGLFIRALLVVVRVRPGAASLAERSRIPAVLGASLALWRQPQSGRCGGRPGGRIGQPGHGVLRRPRRRPQPSLLGRRQPRHRGAAQPALRGARPGRRLGLRLGGPLVGAGLYAGVGGWTLALVGAAGFLTAAAAVAAMRVRKTRPEPFQLRWPAEVGAGLRHMWAERALRRAVSARCSAPRRDAARHEGRRSGGDGAVGPYPRRNGDLGENLWVRRWRSRRGAA